MNKKQKEKREQRELNKKKKRAEMIKNLSFYKDIKENVKDFINY